MYELKKLFFLVAWFLCISNKTHNGENHFVPTCHSIDYALQRFSRSDEGFIRMRNSIIAPYFSRADLCNNGETPQIIAIINAYAPKKRCPRHFTHDEEPSGCYLHEDYSKNYYVSIAGCRTITIINVNTLEEKAISRKKLTGNFTAVCLSPDEKFLSVACEIAVPHNHLLGNIIYSLGFYSKRELIIKTISLENDYFYHEKQLDLTDKYYEIVALFYRSCKYLSCLYIQKPFQEKYHTMCKKLGGKRNIPSCVQVEYGCVLTLQQLQHHKID